MTSHSSQLRFPQRSVVSSFIFVKTEGESKVALFKRSGKVSTYRYHLAPISGNIEPHETPTNAAWRELREETSLTLQDLDFWREGKPYSFSDPSVGRQWTIYPFSFQLKGCDEGGRGENGIQIDWEHESWAWHDPKSIRDSEDFGGVPRLKESLRRVWFEGDMSEGASEALIRGLKQLRTDHTSGSNELTVLALKAYHDVITLMKGEINTTWWDTARMVAWHLWKNGRPSMGAATLNALLALLAEMQETLTGSLDREIEWETLHAACHHHIHRRKAISKRIQTSFAAYLKSNFVPIVNSRSKTSLAILTLSASSTIRDSLVDAFASIHVPRLELRILESRPLYEGVRMASSIVSAFQTRFPCTSERELQITIYTDASAALASQNLDFVLLGADQISDCGSVSNKTGSLPAVLSAKQISPKSKVLIITALEKVAGSTVDDYHSHEANDPKEVMNSWLACGVTEFNTLNDGAKTAHHDQHHYMFEVKNIYFEWVPAEAVDAYVCEEGTLNLAGIKEKAKEVNNKIERFFGDL
ncbi:hypothetical protein N7520_002316 [Penicillium odoratum]|uniref:uncharacterized protein n=1 Tax=Penicillium odoratum TaxID=1167516 RepID=UPI0025495CBD|nr:uncharacterized protein N7520_002316 [Penicillium odoratum]KAJ5771787.1 hypothetical protein N7520_002316 [Penicillium odoratum]